MSDNWLEIADEAIDAQAIMQQIGERVDGYEREGEIDPVSIAEVVRQEIIGSPIGGDALTQWISVWPADCNLVPKYYKIDWRIPILGPINALVRRIIRAEIDRYLLPSLEKQTILNHKLLNALQALAQENEELKQALAESSHSAE
jgi:hypothetical protein